jgi:CPA2 family monovalent cation:H+ antiporter-2
MEIPLLSNIVIIFGLSIAVLLLCYRLHVPAIVGYLLTGVVAGPHGLGLIGDAREVELLAEIGVVMLLFTIGIEFSLKSLVRIKRSALIGGPLQVLATLTAAFFIVRELGLSWRESIFVGFLISLSSTAIVLKLFQESATVDSPHGSAALGILIFQDIIIVPMILLTPLLAGSSGNLFQSLLVLSAKGIGILLLAFISARWIVPTVMYQVARTRSRELFLLSIVALCLGVAWLTHHIGLSLALGAFLAGLILSESEYSGQALGSILPFRDVFMSFFFISIGMLLDVGFLLQRPGLVAVIALCVLSLKAIIAGSTGVLLGFPLRTTILVGLALSQIGEFSFILSRSGIEYGLLPAFTYQLFLVVSVLTMAATPFVLALGYRAADLALHLPLPKRLKAGLYFAPGAASTETKIHQKDHLIIVGYGLNGRNVARSARAAGIPYVIIEMNPETVKAEKSKGEPIYFGDAIQEAVLARAKIKDARALVVVISDLTATRRIIEIARRLNPMLYIIARTRFVQEMKHLYDLGAHEVIPEEFETSVEIFTRVLVKYLIPTDEIERFTAEVRADGYEMLRSLSKDPTSLTDLKFHIPDIEISALRVHPSSPLVGKSPAQIQLRKKYGVTLLAIRRNSKILSDIGGRTRFRADDILVLLAQPHKITAIKGLFRKPEEEGMKNQF